MIIENKNEIWVTAITTVHRDKSGESEIVDIYIPDFGITVHSDSYLPARIRAGISVHAIYEAYMSRGMPIQSTVTEEEAQLMCTKPNMFVVHLKLEYSGGNKT